MELKTIICMKKLSTLLIALSLGYVAEAQIPNASFENWTAFTGYDRPNEWSTADSALAALVPGTHTCDKMTPAPVGTYYMKLTSVTVPLVGVLPGVAASGAVTVSGTTVVPRTGFPMSTRPQNLTGQWQYTPSGADQGSIMILTTKWNGTSRDTVSFTNHLLSGTVSSFTTFSIPLTYIHGSTPDTGIIFILSGKATGGVAGSTVSIDDLAFTGSVPNGVVNVNSNKSEISIFPNPASKYANVSYMSTTAGNVHITVTNVSGRVVSEMDYKKMRGSNDFPIQVSKMAAGMYYVQIADEQGTAVRKLFVE